MAVTRGSTMQRQKRRNRRTDPRRWLLPLAALLIVAALAVFIGTRLAGRSSRDAAGTLAVQPALSPSPAPEGVLTAAMKEIAAAADEIAAATPEAAPTPAPTPDVAAMRAQTRPTPTAPGFTTVFSRANTKEKVVAITVDDCFQADNLRAMVDAAIEVGAKFTIFPIGENALRPKVSEALKYAWENGFELENHTFSHNGLYNCSDEQLAEEVYKQQMALSYILGVEYQCHFLRPMGGDACHDQRLQKYAEQLGYCGIARWCASSGSGTVSDKKLAKQLEPGAIFLFHTTDKDRDKLVRFLPWLVSQGYQVVTLNEMFGYPENETKPLTKPITEYEIPPLEPYERVYVTYRRTTYAYGVYQLQEKLVELGYMTGEPDGVYGPGCENAVKKYQQDHGLKVTGVADPELQRMIFEG